MAMDMNVALKISAGVTGQQSVDQLRTSMDKLNGAASSIGRGFDVAKTAVGAFLAIQAVQGIAALAKNTIDAADAMNDMSQRTGIAVGVLSELDYAAKMNGSSIDAVQTALGKLSVKAFDAATGNKAATATFDALGISLRNADGSMKSSVTLLEQVGDAFKSINDPTVKSALAIEIFGKSGAQMIPVIENMSEARREAQQLGITLGDEFAGRAATFNDNLDKMAATASALSRALLNELLPSVNRIMDAMVDARKAGEGTIWAGFRQVTREAVYDFKDLDKSIVDVTAKIGRLAEMQAALSKDSLGASINRFFSREDLAIVNTQLSEAQAVLAQLKAMRGDKEAGGGRGNVNPQAVVGASDSSILDRINAAKLGDKAAEEASKAAIKLADQRKQVLVGLNDEIQKMVLGEDALTIAKLRQLGASEKEIAQAQALMTQRAQLTAADREMDVAIKQNTKLTEDATRAKEKLADAGKRLFDETRTPAEKLNIELANLNDLLAKGAIDWDTYSRAVFKAQDDFDEVGKKGKDTMSDLKQALEGWGRQATDTFVDFAFTGKSSFKDLVNSILQDIARMMIQKTIMAPLMSSLGGMFGFANGGIMTNQGSMPLNAYAGGGIANSPQVALFGEGRMPEAYVPLPDGRTIPVTMSGGASSGTSVVVNVNVESGKTDTQGDQGAGNLGRLIAGAVKSELINQKRPGGLLAA